MVTMEWAPDLRLDNSDRLVDQVHPRHVVATSAALLVGALAPPILLGFTFWPLIGLCVAAHLALTLATWFLARRQESLANLAYPGMPELRPSRRTSYFRAVSGVRWFWFGLLAAVVWSWGTALAATGGTWQTENVLTYFPPAATSLPAIALSVLVLIAARRAGVKVRDRGPEQLFTAPVPMGLPQPGVVVGGIVPFVAAGWKPDPIRPGWDRWWNGAEWETSMRISPLDETLEGRSWERAWTWCSGMSAALLVSPVIAGIGFWLFLTYV
jgi:hypothetical protein